MKKAFSLIGIISGLVVILLGILVMTGVFGARTDYASSASYTYDSGYATFGADFYNYVVNNAEEAASASRTVASNLNSIAGFLKTVCGIMLMAFGLFMVCLFGCKLEKKTSAQYIAAPKPESAEPVLTEMSATANESASSPSEEANAAEEREPSANEWKCPKCGKINQNYVSSCGCGETKPL